MRRILAYLIVAGLLAGCSGDDPQNGGGGTMGINETVTVPDAPTGVPTITINDLKNFRTGGSISSLGHPIEYRFDFDSKGSHDYSNWSPTTSSNGSWSVVDTFEIRAQARCATHPSVESGWSDPSEIAVILGIDTEISSVINTYVVGGNPIEESINVFDAIPDTVPYGSCVTIFYTARNVAFDPTNCFDAVNQCVTYQTNYFRESSRVANSQKQEGWLPYDGEDSDSTGIADSTSMNIGSLEYTIGVRALDRDQVPDPTPGQFSIIGNFDPTLDGFSIVNHDGTMIGEGDTIVWDWWAPADSQVNIQDSTETKTFYFLVKANGHDHPKERDGSGVKGWFYDFHQTDNPNIEQPFGQSGAWVSGVATNVLCDTIYYRPVYKFMDWQGDEIFDDPPRWNDVTHDFTIQGRDIANDEIFDQFVINHEVRKIRNTYTAAKYARWTAVGTQRFHIVLRR